MSDPILRVEDIQKYYGNKGSLTKAVDHISFTVEKASSWGSWDPRGPARPPC